MKKIKSNSGETLVEVMLSMMLFLMILAMLQKAIDFNTSAQEKSEDIRTNNANIVMQLRESGMVTTESSATYHFSSSLAGEGDATVLFEIPITYDKKTITYQTVDGETQTVDFAVFGGGS